MSRTFFIPFLVVLLVGVTSSSSATNTSTIELKKAVHFLTPGGEDVVVEQGRYEVDQASEWLHLTPVGGEKTDAILVEAQPIDHQETIEVPTILSRSEHEDEHMITLLLPDGTGFEALGSYSGVRSKAVRRPTVRRPRAAASSSQGIRPAKSAHPKAAVASKPNLPGVGRKKVVPRCEIAPTSSKKKQRQNRPNTLLQVQQFSGEFARWERSWRITSPERLRFRYRPGKTLAVKGFWQISTLPFASHRQQDSRVLVHSGVLPTPKPGKFQLFHINLEKISTVPKSPPSQPRTYYVRAILLDAKDRCVGHSLSVKISYSKSSKPTKFTNLPPSIYTLDRDEDGLPDRLERQLAEQFKPYFIFDSAEKARRSKEPVVLFQVRPEGCIGPGCKKPYRVWIRYAALFANDGGYGPSSDCGNTHEGDHVLIDVIIVNKTGWDSVNNGLRWGLVYIKNWEFEWPGWSAKFYPHQSNFGHKHPTIFLSAHKHHQYFDTNSDEKDSIYSDFGCNDDVNGKGAKIFSNLISPLKDGRPNNVGEPDAHNEAYFINSLEAFGYPGENAWSGKPFRGGHGGDGDGAKFKDIWLDHQFDNPSAGK